MVMLLTFIQEMPGSNLSWGISCSDTGVLWLSSVTLGKCWNSIAQLHCNGTCAEDSFYVWVEQMSPYFLTADMRRRQFSLLLTAGFYIGVAHKGHIHSAALFSLNFPSFAQVCALTYL
jgi:hypothetical protein